MRKIYRLGIMMLLMLAAALPAARAYNFVSDGIYYDITGGSPNTVAVTYATGSYNSYSGEVSIPSTVTYNGTHYTVTAIGNSAFRNCSGLTGVSIPGSVTSIGESAFYGCSGLTSVTIPNGVETIGASAFYYCGNLHNVSLPGSLTTIGASAFYYSGLYSVTIPAAVTSIGSKAFRQCSSLRSANFYASNCTSAPSIFYGCSHLDTLTIGSNVHNLPGSVFSNLSALKKVHIPNSVTSMGNNPFAYCPNLDTIVVAAGNSVFSSGNHSSYIVNSSTHTLVTGCKRTVIPNSVTHIGGAAFAGCTGLTGALTIPNQITIIGANAYSGCSGLTSLTIGHGVDSIGNSAFYSCSSISSVSFNADSCRYMASSAGLSECSSFSTLLIGNNVKAIPAGAFRSCNHLTGMLVIPNSVKHIGNSAFYDCNGLTSLSIGNSVTSIGESAFYNCSNMGGTLTIPQSVKTIGSSAFYNCTNFSAIVFNADSCTTGSFSGCSNVTSLTIGNNVKVIPASAFSGLSQISGVLTIPNSVLTIGNNAFSNCSGLTGTLTIPNSVLTIGNNAFSNCSGLTSVVFNADSCVSMGGSSSSYSVFSGCTGPTTLTIGENVKVIPAYAFRDFTGLTGTLTIPNSVLTIGNNAFSNCSGLTSLTIGNVVSTIGNNAFSNCGGLTSLIIGNAVSTIGNNAFSSCSGLTSLTIGNAVSTIGSNAFSNCSGLTSVVFNADSCTTMGNQYYPVFSGSGDNATLTIGSNVKYIPNYAFDGFSGLSHVIFNADSCTMQNYYSSVFRNCANLTSLTIGENVKYIHSYAFYGCNALTGTLIIPNSVKIIGANAFSGCGMDTLILGRTISSIGASAFSGCSTLVHVAYNPDSCMISNFGSIFNNCGNFISLVIGQNVKIIPPYIFSGCTGLTGSLIIPDSVHSIGDHAFQNCSGYDSLVIGSGLKEIGEYVFYGCEGLSGTLNFPCNIATIKRYAFGDCYRLTGALVISDFVTTIAQHAFDGCSGFDTLIIGKSVARIEDDAFANCSKLRHVSFNADSCTDMGNWGYWVRNCDSIFSISIGDNVKNIPAEAFYNFTGLSGMLRIPDSVITIGQRAFSHCRGIDSLIIGHSVASIIHEAFSYCTNLKVVVFNADSCTSMGNGSAWNSRVFSYCDSLTSLIFGNTVKIIPDYAFYDCNNLTEPLTLPNSLVSIGNRSFSNCSSLTGTLFIPDAVTTIGDYAFQNCSGIESLIIGNSVTSINSNTFSGCTSLDTIVIGKAIQSIYGNAFQNCTSLRIIFFNADSCVTLGTWDNYYSMYNNSAFNGCTSLSYLNIGENVKYIPFRAFYNCNHITGTIHIPDSLKIIEESAFEGCTSIDTLIIGKSMQTIEGNAFKGCTELTHVTFNADSCTTMRSSSNNSAFNGCTNISSLSIGENVKNIPAYAFIGKNKITGTLTIPDSVVKIGESAFSGCSGYTSLLLGQSVDSIGGAAFRFCNNLSGSLFIPNAVEFIGSLAFEGCTSLTNLILGRSVDSIGPEAFHNCTALNSIYCYPVNAPAIRTYYTSHSFLGVSKYTQVHVPCGSEPSYQSTWTDVSNLSTASYFYNIYETLQPYLLTAIPADTLQGTVHVTTQPTCTEPAVIEATPKFFYVFDHWSDGSTDNPRTIELTQDTTLVAHFREYALNINCDTAYGRVVILQAPTAENPQAVVEVVPNKCYLFYEWSDILMTGWYSGSEAAHVYENPRTITLTQDTTMRVYFNYAHPVGIKDTKTELCEGDSTVLKAFTYSSVWVGDTIVPVSSSTEGYLWGSRTYNNNEGTYSVDTLGWYDSLMVNSEGTYWVVGIDSSGCTASSDVSVHVKPHPTLILTGKTDICTGDTATITASTPYDNAIIEDFSEGLPSGWISSNDILSIYQLDAEEHGSAILFPAYSLSEGSTSELTLPTVNLNHFSYPYLEFNTAYWGRSYHTSNESLRVLLSTDNGVSWEEIFSKSGVQLRTCSTCQTNVSFYPTDNQWRNRSISLVGYKNNGYGDVKIKFELQGGSGNNVWIDDVKLYSPYSYYYGNYSWDNGSTERSQRFDSTGTYIVTVSDDLDYWDESLHEWIEYRCSSTDSVTVTVWHPDTTELTVDAATTSYTLNGETFCTSGDYTQILQNIHGCDSVVNLHLTMPPTDTIEISETMCGADRYLLVNAPNSMIEDIYSMYGFNMPYSDTIFFSAYYPGETPVSISKEYWAENDYVSASYYDTYTSVQGCDSTVLIHENYYPVDYVLIWDTICGRHIWQGDSLYYAYWDNNVGEVHQIFVSGDTLTKSGFYYQYYTNSHGCDSIYQWNLVFIPSLIEDISATACDSYTWNGITYTESGDYTMNSDTTFAVVRELYYENSAYFTWGYDDADGNFISFLPRGWNYWQVHEEYDAETGNYTYNYYYTDQYGVEHLYNPGDVVPYIDTVSGCKSVTLHLTINPSVTNLVEATACDSYTWNDSTYTTSGEYTQTFTAANGCDSVVTLYLTVNESKHTDTTAGSCGSYTWNDETYTTSGEYTQTFTAANGCDSVVTLHLTILPLPTPNITGVTTVCEGQTATLNATGGVSYLWEDGTTTNTYPATVSGLYTVTATNAEGCSATASATVTVNPLPEVAITGNTAICPGGSTILTATGAATYMWSNGSSNASIPVNTFGQYSVIGTSAEGCFSTASITVLVSQPPVITINGNTNLCAGESTTLTATGGVSYMWSNGSTDSAIAVNTAGNWQVIGYNDNNCSNMASVTVNVWQPASSDLYITAFDSCYMWFGTPRCESGNYTYTLQTIHGCDSVITLHLTLEDAITTEFNATSCDSYTWNGATYTVSGNYTQSFTAVNGNDSIVTLHLTVNNPVHTAVTAESCGSYEWNGQTYTVSGDYTHEHLDANGCTQVDTLHLTIFNPVHTAVTAGSCGPYEWNGQTYTVSGDYTHEHLDANGCTQVDTLHLTVNDTLHIEFADSTCTAYVWNGQTYTASGDYTQTFAAANGCDSVVTLHLTIVPAITPVISVTGSLAACGDGSATLTVPGLYNSFAWSTGSTDPAITVSEAGFYWVTATDVYGCEGVSEMVQVGSSVQIEETPAICMVGVEDQHNLVVWEPLADTDVAEYRLYRENGQANIFEPLAVIPAGSGNTYADTTADPSVRAWRYKITTADTCGGETPMSALHKTVHLTINQGLGNSYNLIWTPYEGFEFASYRLYRGTANNNLQLIQTMPSTLTSFTDQNPAGDALFYQIEVVMDGNCVQETRDITFSGARSNIVYNGVPVATDVAVEACESYDWNGEVLTSSGEYTRSFNSVLGYDSVVTLHLTIHQPATSEFTVSCPDSCYTWNGTEYCASGDYTQTLQTVHGCDSVVTLHLTITVGIDDHDLAGSVKVFPNPANDFVNVQCTMYNVQLGADLHVFDVYGKLVQTVPMAGETTILNISSLANGMYFVRVTTEDGMVTKPFVVKR